MGLILQAQSKNRAWIEIMALSLPQHISLHSDIDTQKKLPNNEEMYTITCLRTNRQEHYQLHKGKKTSNKVSFLQGSSITYQVYYKTKFF